MALWLQRHRYLLACRWVIKQPTRMILAASVCTRSGKVILSRQFEAMGADKIQELFANFGKLVSDEAQHTVVEADDVRYVYEPLEDLFVVLISDLNSNILQDIGTLRLASQCVAAKLHSGLTGEKDVSDNAFEIIAAFDEIINSGYSENLTLSQVETFLEMESHEEKIQEIIERNKELEAADMRKQKARELEQQRKAAKRGMPSGFNPAFGDGGASPFQSAPSYTPPQQVQSSAPSTYSSFKKAAPKGKGLQLGKKKEEPLLPSLPKVPPQGGAARSSSQATPAPESTSTELSIIENLTIDASRNGEIRSARVEGKLQLYAGDRENARLRISAATEGPSNAYKTNPKMDRGLFAKDRVLALKNQSEQFPQSSVLLLKWIVENVKVPLVFTVWVSQSSDPGFLSVTIEYELAEDFVDTIDNVNVAVPLPHANAHVVDPTSIYDQFDDHIVWMIPSISAETPSGMFEFTAEADDEESFFPIHASFSITSASETFGQVTLSGVSGLGGEAVPYETSLVVQTNNYIIN